MLASFLSFLQKQQLITDNQQTTLLAVSGGVDSVTLCHLFKQAALPFAIAHCHFNLRKQEADATSQFVQNLAQHYGVPCYSTKFETKAFASHHKISIQMAARTLRYQFFHQLLHKEGLAQIATAHHWDDAVETILLNFIKGTGIRGLQGIQPINSQIIRPLLFASKKEIIAYAKQEALAWHEDSSNQSLYYQRNFIRNKIIPLLHQLNPNFSTTMKETAAKLNDVGNVFQCQIDQLKKTILRVQDPIHYLEISQITHLPGAATVAFELVRAYGFTFKQIKSLLQAHSSSGKRMYATDYVLYVDRKKWFICKKKATQPSQVTIVACNSTAIHYGQHTFYFQTYNRQAYPIPKTAMIAALDYHKLAFPLTIRRWQTGDFFYPLGMQGRKKLSDFFIDLKIPMVLKDTALVVTSNQQIIWVVGYRIDQRFAIDDQTEKIMEIVLA